MSSVAANDRPDRWRDAVSRGVGVVTVFVMSEWLDREDGSKSAAAWLISLAVGLLVAVALGLVLRSRDA